MPEDVQGELLDGRFEFRALKDGRVIVSCYGQPVTTLAGRDAERFLKRVDGLEDHAAQLLMARDREFQAGQRALNGERTLETVPGTSAPRSGVYGIDPRAVPSPLSPIL